VKFIKPILLGIIAAGGALVFELLIQGFFPNADLSAASYLDIILLLVIAAAIEEFFKLLIIYKSFFLQKINNHEFLYSALLLGFGFALTEVTISNYFSLPVNSELYLGLLGIILIHTLLAGLIGYLLLRIRTGTFSALAFILLTVTLLHFVYNFGIISGYLQK
jgi:hypothetical protein